MHSSNRIALSSQGGKEWIAGIIYNHNLIRAFHYLPKNERPQLDIFLGPTDDLSYHKELGNLLPLTHHYQFRKNASWRSKINRIKDSFLSLRWPLSLESLSLRVKPKVLFPFRESLGKDFPSPWIGWIPDFQHKHFPQYFSKEEIVSRDLAYERLLKESWHTVVSSHHSYADLKRFFPGFEKKTSVLSFCSVATEEWYHDDPQIISKKFNLPNKFLILPSQFWIHKNHQVVFKALALLKVQGFSDIALVCTGHTEDYRQPEHFISLKKFIETNDLQCNVYILGLLERWEQIQLIRRSVAVIQPSYFEGWSSLVEDARALGKKIFVSDIPVHREQNPPDALFFIPDDAHMLVDLIGTEWKNLDPGPDLDKERIALIEQHQRIQTYARTFLELSNKVLRAQLA